MKELQFNLFYSENVPKIQFEQEVETDCKHRGFWSHPRFRQVYFQTEQSTIEKAEEETMLQPSTVSSSRPSQMLTYSFVITRKGETL
jgi:hypothetical protein